MKFRLTVTATREYEVNPKDYPTASTPEEMLAMDQAAISDDPDIMLDHPDTHWDIQVEEAIIPSHKKR